MPVSDGWKNLVPANKENAVARGRLGGIASGKTKRERRTMREELEFLLSLPDDELDGVTQRTAVLISMIRQAKRGSVRASEFLRDTLGEKPTQKDNDKISGNIIVAWANDKEDKPTAKAMPEVCSLPCS